MNRTILTLARSALLVLTALLAASPALARSSKTWGFQMWAASTYVAPLDQSQQNATGVGNAVQASNEMGYQLGAEFRSGVLGLAFDYLHSREELSRDTAGLLGTADFNPISATLVLHLPSPVLELSAGPTVSYVNWGDLDVSGGGTRPMDARFGFGVTTGAGMPLGRSFALTAGMRWLKLQAAPQGIPAVTVDPLISHLGLALRF